MNFKSTLLIVLILTILSACEKDWDKKDKG